jgi:lysophospholipase L1-like esterase
MILENKKINFLGDSITQGCGTSSPEHIFVNLLKEQYHLAAARNYGIGGTRIAPQIEPYNEFWDAHDFLGRIDEMDDDADVVVVFGGTNDFGHGDAPLGTFEDRTVDTFYGALHCLCLDLIAKYPDATIVFMTPLHRGNEDNIRGDGNKPPYGVLKTYVDIIKEVTAFYSLPTLDLWSCSGIQPRVPQIRDRYCPDQLHPNDAGHALIASRLIGFLKSL